MFYRLSRLLAPLALLTTVSTVQAQALPTAVVHEQPGCGCCHLWVEHLKASGFATRAAVAQDIWQKKVKSRKKYCLYLRMQVRKMTRMQGKAHFTKTTNHYMILKNLR